LFAAFLDYLNIIINTEFYFFNEVASLLLAFEVPVLEEMNNHALAY